MNLENAKRVLGLYYAVTEDELKSLYRDLCMRMHPDHNQSPNAHAEFVELQQAYALVKKNLPLLPKKAKPAPVGYTIFRIFSNEDGNTVQVPKGILGTQDVVLYFFWNEVERRVVIPKGTALPTTINIVGTRLHITFKEYEEEAHYASWPPLRKKS